MIPAPQAPTVQPPTPSRPTVVAALTPAGQGGIAIVEVVGPRAFEMLRALFRPKRGRQPEPDAWAIHYGHIVDEAGVVDEVLVRLVPGEEPTVEVNCHGGQAAVLSVLDCFARLGAREAEPSALAARRARNAIEAEAIEAIQHAATDLGVEVLLDQLGGALARAVRGLPWGRPCEAAAELCGLLASTRLGKALWQPLRVTIVGPVNAGKSALFNALACEERMIVSEVPGTTRDAVSALVGIGGLPVVLTDTAGEQEPSSAIEREAQARARAAGAEADLALLVLDGSATEPPRAASCGPRRLVALNKRDLGLAPWAQEAANVGATAVSALHGDGLAELSDRIVERLVGEARYHPGRPVPFTERQERLLAAALDALEAARPEDAKLHLEGLVAGSS